MKSVFSSRVRFGLFELNLQTRELHGQDKIKALQEQPFRLLVLLLERDGEVVSREEIRQALWADGTRVEFDPGINQAVKNLRDTLSDSGTRYIVTVKGRGYLMRVSPQWVPRALENAEEDLSTGKGSELANLSKIDAKEVLEDGEPAKPSKMRGEWSLGASVVVFAVALIVSIVLYYHSQRVQAFTDKDSILIADFFNSTGDPVFDDTLRQGLAVQLEQSPFLQLLSERKVNATLKLMGRPITDRLSAEAAREVCLRAGGTVMATGAISQLGSQYVVDVKALNCDTGDVLGEAQEQAATKERVLKAVDAAAVDLRRRLGESLASLQRYSTPLDEATTPSLEALKAYSLARKQKFSQGDGASLKFYDRAVELDPNFAVAYQGRSAAYRNLNELERARVDASKAYDLRRAVSDRERFSIEAAYYLIWTGELEKAAQTYELWEQTYPRDYVPSTNLGFIYVSLGKPEKALDQAREAMRLQPNDGGSYSNLGGEYQNLNRLEEAEGVYRQALEHKVEGPYLLTNLYSLAFLKGDTATMAKSTADASGKPGVEDLLLAAEADTEAWHGRFKNARHLTLQAMDSALRNEAKETAAAYQVLAALREVEADNRKEAVADAHEAMKLGPNRDVRSMAALALALGGETNSAERIANELDKIFPLDTLVQRYWLPAIRAAIALSRNDANRAVEYLAAASALDLSEPAGVTVYLVPAYVRGQAYLKLHDGQAAQAEFQKLVDHYGLVGNFPWGALARLGIARAYVMQGNTSEAKAAYRQFLGLWNDADADIPLYQEAKSELANLQ